MIRLILSLLIMLSVQFSFAEVKPVSVGEHGCTPEITMDGVIGLGSLVNLERGLSYAKKNKCESLLILINTPGGSLETTRLIVERILNSPVPVLCLVHPSGGHAGSAGAIIMQACHVSGAMVATNIGAATPISGTGQDIPDDLKKKLFNDTISWLEGITKLRGRNVKFSEDIVKKAKAVSAKEAKKIGAIDCVAEKKADFLLFAEGRKVKLSENQETTVAVHSVIVLKPNLKTKFVSIVSDPQIAYMMFMASLGLLYFEITHPGAMVPGVLGGIGLVVSLISLHKLDVTWGALLLILLGIGFMIAEAFVPSFGMLGIGGVISFAVGSIFLFDPDKTGYQLPYTVIMPTVILTSLLMFLVAYMAIKTRNVKYRAEFGNLVGNTGTVVKIKPQNPKRGMIEVNGETWKFRSEQDVNLNATVEVTGHKGLILIVKNMGQQKES